MTKKFAKGFTLIELLVVIGIIAVLATLSIVGLQSARQKSRDAKRVADVRQIQTALELYNSDKNTYPAGTAVALGATGATKLTSDNGFTDTAAASGETTYMGQVPVDSTSTTACTTASTATCDYGYSLISTNVYQILFFLEGTAGSISPGLHCATQNGINNNEYNAVTGGGCL